MNAMGGREYKEKKSDFMAFECTVSHWYVKECDTVLNWIASRNSRLSNFTEYFI